MGSARPRCWGPMSQWPQSTGPLALYPTKRLQPNVDATLEPLPGVHRLEHGPNGPRPEGPFAEGPLLPIKQVLGLEVFVVQDGRLIHVHFFPIGAGPEPVVLHHLK